MPEALYRRYRPETFADVIGQEHVTEPLSQALRKNHVHHAYLFSGPRGCGKTTSARILARCLNCEKGPTPTPCGTCQSCQDLARGGPGSIDVVEIDAASHGGVDDARDLREKAFFAPASSRYKVYIVDEAHMVSPQGFNALLKVVEEPPEHLKFVFATTEPEKVIGTIRSRTHHYPFRLVPPSRLQEHLAAICEREGVTAEPGVLPLVVRAGRGSVRDALSVLDQLVAGAGDEGVTYALATALLGYTDSSLLDAAVDAFAAGDGAAAFTVIDRVIEGGLDPRRFAEDLLERLRDLLVLVAVPEAAGGLLAHCPADQLERMRLQSEHVGLASLSRAADIVSAGLTEMRGTTTPRLQLELVVARVLLPAAEGGERSLGTRLERVERLVSGGAPMPAPTVPPPVSPVSTVSSPAQPASAPSASAPSAPAPSVPPATVPPASAQPQPPAAEGAAPSGQRPAPEPAPAGHDVAGVRALWPEVLGKLAALKRTTWTLVSSQATVVGVGEGALTLAFPTPGLREQFAGRSDHTEYVHQALIDVLGVDWRIEAVVGGGPAATTGSPVPPAARPASPIRPAAPAAPREALGPAPRPATRPVAPPPPVATVPPEQDIPEADDPDLDDSGLTGIALLERDLGARVIGEYDTA